MKVNDQGIGWGAAISQLINRPSDFGASDAPMNGEQDSLAMAHVLHIPITVSAVVLSYNLPELKDTLRLSPQVLAGTLLACTLALSTTQRLRPHTASARTYLPFRHYIPPSARNYRRTFTTES